MAQAPILGAGGIVVRGSDKPLIAVVQRRKDDGWVLPKGKLKRNESAIAGAEREVVEETGQDVVVHDFLGAISFTVNRKPKVVQFWRMEATDRPARKPTKDIKAVKWLPLESAIKKLDDPLEQLFLRNVAERALPIAAAIVEQVSQPSAVAEQPTALTLPIVEPSFAAGSSVRKERLPDSAPMVAEPIPKPSVLPTPPALPVVLATSAPKQATLAAPTAKPVAEPSVLMRPVALSVVTRPTLPVVTNLVDVSSVATSPASRVPVAAKSVAALAVVANPAQEPPAAIKPTAAVPGVTKPAATLTVVAKPSAEPPAAMASVAPPPFAAKPATPERSVVIPPIVEPRAPSTLFGRVLQRLQLDWNDQRRHWTTGIARRTGR
jgi:8-oxo-dGTP diphosphatase